MVKCKNCGAEFQSRVQMSEQSFKTALLERQTESCPQCKKETTFTKDDYYFR
jgi:hypothetical protein